jgi:hypothetical protein
MAGKKEYEAVFSFGGKLKASFGAAVGAVKKSFAGLGKAAQAVGKVFGTVFRGFQLALGGLAAFALANVFRKIFGGAEQAAKDALKRTQQLTAALSANPRLQKLGAEVIKGQVLALQQVSAELGKQGVIHSDHFEQASRTLALYGTGPQTIAKMLPVLADALVATKGINASVEDMDDLVKGVTKAIGTGQVKALSSVGIMMDKNQQKAFKAMTATERQTKLVEILTQKYKGANEAAVDTDLGKIQRFHNMMAAFSENIGLQMVPMQAKLASFWTEVLPTIEPIAKDVFKAISDAMGDTAIFATDVVVPAIKELAGFFKSPEWSEGVAKLGDAFNALGATLKPLTDSFGLTGGEARGFAKIITDEIAQTITDFTKLAEKLNRVLTGIGDAWNASVSALQAAGPQLEDFGQSLGKLAATEWATFEADLERIGQKITSAFSDAYNGVKDIWAKLPEMFKGLESKISSALAAVTEAIKKPFLDAINAIKQAWDSLVGAITSFKMPDIGGAIQKGFAARPKWLGGTGGEAAAHQYGGIFNRPHLAQVAEAGIPEAIIPLQRSARSRGLLGAAAGAIGAGPMPGGAGGAGGRTTLNFAPSVSIAGNATRETVAELDRSLRNLADDFLARWNQAQEQERRLAFS